MFYVCDSTFWVNKYYHTVIISYQPMPSWNWDNCQGLGCVGQGHYTESDIDRSACAAPWRGLGEEETMVTSMHVQPRRNRHVCMWPRWSPASTGSPDASSQPSTWVSLSRNLTSNLWSHGIPHHCYLYRVINSKYNHNIQTSFGLGIKRAQQRHLWE